MNPSFKQIGTFLLSEGVTQHSTALHHTKLETMTHVKTRVSRRYKTCCLLHVHQGMCHLRVEHFPLTASVACASHAVVNSTIKIRTYTAEYKSRVTGLNTQSHPSL